MKIILILIVLLTLGYAENNFYCFRNKKIFLIPINSHKKIQRSLAKNTDTIRYYKTSNGNVVGIGNELIIKLKNGIKPASLTDIYNIIIKKELFKNTYLVEVNCSKETLNIGNQLTLDKNVIYAIPNFIKKMHKR